LFERRLRYAIVGAGVMGRVHARSLAVLHDDVELVGVADSNRELAEQCASGAGASAFDDYHALLDALSPDVVVVATPHLSHAAVSIDCLEHGAHVIVEKPMAIDVAEADAMLLAARTAARHLVVDLQYRFVPAVEAAKELIDAGRVGRIIRASCVESTMRSAAYYRSAPWRGTWAGEGGGVLVNQAPHPLDLLCYLAGPAARVAAWTETLSHAIECEDTVAALVSFEAGGIGQLAFSTAEPTPLRIELIGDRAKLELTLTALTITDWSPSLSRHIDDDRTMYDPPEARSAPVELRPYGGEGAAHDDLHRDVVAALRDGRVPRVDAASVLPSVELANAIVLSSENGGTSVELPLDRDAFTDLLAAKRGAVR
jgi:predicted dehydrogenase